MSPTAAALERSRTKRVLGRLRCRVLGHEHGPCARYQKGPYPDGPLYGWDRCWWCGHVVEWKQEPWPDGITVPRSERPT